MGDTKIPSIPEENSEKSWQAVQQLTEAATKLIKADGKDLDAHLSDLVHQAPQVPAPA